METISQVLFWVANSLLIPDIILLLLLFIRSLLLIGGVYNQYMTNRHIEQIHHHAQRVGILLNGKFAHSSGMPHNLAFFSINFLDT